MELPIAPAVVEWCNARAVAPLGRLEAPVISLLEGIATDEAVVLVSALLRNRRSQPLLQEWYAVPFVGGARTEAIPFSHLGRAGEDRAPPLPNRNAPADLAALRALIPSRRARARDHAGPLEGARGGDRRQARSRARAARGAARAPLERADGARRARSQPVDVLPRSGARRQPPRAALSAFLRFVEDSMTAGKEPFIEVLAVFRNERGFHPHEVWYRASRNRRGFEATMMNHWYPVSPSVDKNGALRALHDLDVNAPAMPVPLPPGKRHFNAYAEEYSFLELNAAATLGITAVGDFGASLSSLVLVQDSMFYSDAIDLAASPVRGTRWGAGVRLAVRVEQLEASMDLNLGTVAAASELGLLRASFEVVGLGFNNPFPLTTIPGPGRFDRSSFASIQGVMDVFKARYADPKHRKAELLPLPLMVQLDRAPRASAVDEARATVRVVRLLSDSKTLAQAIALLDGQVDEEHIKDVYSRVGGVKAPDDRPGWGARRAARKWLFE